MRFKVLLNDQEQEIEVVRQGDRLRVSYGGQAFAAKVIHTEGAHFVLEVEEAGPDGFVYRKRIRAAGYSDGDNRQLWANGRLVNYQKIDERAPAAAAGDVASLSPSIPAVVSELLVEPGSQVRAGDQLVLLESMKMILPVQAPYDGRVTAVHCAVGDAVQPGVQLIELEPDS